MTKNIGINLATVTILLINAAVSTPRRIKKCTPHNKIEATIILGSVLPPLNIGKSFQLKTSVMSRKLRFQGRPQTNIPKHLRIPQNHQIRLGHNYKYRLQDLDAHLLSFGRQMREKSCLLYTSDAADE